MTTESLACDSVLHLRTMWLTWLTITYVGRGDHHWCLAICRGLLGRHFPIKKLLFSPNKVTFFCQQSYFFLKKKLLFFKKKVTFFCQKKVLFVIWSCGYTSGKSCQNQKSVFSTKNIENFATLSNSSSGQNNMNLADISVEKSCKKHKDVQKKV